MRVLVVSVLFLLAGCATVAPTTLPSGERGFEVTCYEGRAECMDLAARQCRGPYEILDQAQEEDLYMNPGVNGYAYAGTSTTNRMIVRCRS